MTETSNPVTATILTQIVNFARKLSDLFLIKNDELIKNSFPLIHKYSARKLNPELFLE